MSRDFDPVELLARLNPVPAERVDELAGGPERAATLARVRTRRGAIPTLRRRQRRRLVAVVVVAVALGVPALAFAGDVGSLFDFSNHGTPVTRGDLSSVTALHFNEVDPRSLVQLRAVGSWAVYDAKTANGNLCFYEGPANETDPNHVGLSGGCFNSAKFPSPSEPVWDISLYESAPPAAGATVRGPNIARLAGVAADGVASIQLLALSDCHVVATAPVVDNVYLADNLPLVPEAQIVARDADGNVVWHEAVTPASSPYANSCGLG